MRSLLFGIIWVMIVLSFTYNEAVFPILWREQDFCLIWPKLIKSLGMKSYLFANLGIVTLLVIEIVIENTILTHKLEITGIFMLLLLFGILLIIILYFYCSYKDSINLKDFLLWTYFLGWIGVLIFLKFKIFYNIVKDKIPIMKLNKQESREILN